MAHQITKCENKSADWKVVTILNAAGDLIPNVSVNRTNKKGEVFPDFDSIKEGATIAGTLWQSPTDKMYLFGPKGGTKAPAAPTEFATSNAEIKNILTLKVIPLLEAIYKQNPPIKKETAYDVEEADRLVEDSPF